MNSRFNRVAPWPVSVVPTKLPQPNNSRHHQRHNFLIIKVNTNVDIRLFASIDLFKWCFYCNTVLQIVVFHIGNR